MMPFTRPKKEQPVITAVLLDVLENVPTHWRPDRGGTVACRPGACLHCKEEYRIVERWYGPAALVQEAGIRQPLNSDLEARMEAIKQRQKELIPATADHMQRARIMGSAEYERLGSEAAELVKRRPPPVKSWSLIPYPSRSGRFLPSFYVAEVGDLGDLPNESGAVLRWEKRGHTRVTFCGLMQGELPAAFDWRTGLAKLIGQWWTDEVEGEEPATIRFPGRKIG